MTSDDAEALWAWVQTPTGEDDLRRLEATADALEFHDPRRARCAARVGELRRAALMQRDGWSTPSRWRCTACRAPPWAEHRTRCAERHLAARARPRGRPRRRGRRDARQERLDRLQPARQPVRRGRRRAPARRPLPARAGVPRHGRRASPTATTSPASSTTCSRARTSAPTSPSSATASCGSCSSAACRACRSCRAWTPRSATTRTRWRSARSCSRTRPPEAVDRYIANGLRRFTPNTITEPDELRAELRDIRRTGVADRARGVRRRLLLPRRPDPRPRRRFLGAVGISMSRRAFDEEHERARGDAPRRRQIPAICGFPHRS